MNLNTYHLGGTLPIVDAGVMLQRRNDDASVEKGSHEIAAALDL